MRRLVLMSVLALASVAAHAASTLRIGSQVLTVGESASRAIQLLGEPSFKEPIETRHGGYVGQRWQYQRENSQVTTLTVIGGKVTKIEELSN
ncbi:hypothetical protein FHW84_000637 [Dyella sp. SG562]|uniref:DUF2845 domain-containing protein n=1 Tax=Dyella TaxID=231454 RepID=UPI00141F4D77|nr:MULTISPECIES: DUF2845 domain-containing protein [unclassified Dyella]NII72081.1 hypothetical protein [Dyella sp. SG562]NKJ23212.1 hypothetical protein [Dyella sp. SG609]